MNKQFKIKEMAALLNISHNAIRNWINKPVEGQVWHAGIINYVEFKRQALKKFSLEDLEKKLGCKIDEVEFTIGERQVFEGIPIEDLVVGCSYILRNFHYEKNVTFLGIAEVEDLELWIFQNDKGEYVTYDETGLTKNTLKIIEA